MTQIGFGLTQGPNGPQISPVLMMTPSAPSEPESYENYFETPEGVTIHVTYRTPNKVQSDRYSDELAQKMGWKVLESTPEGPKTLAGEIGEAWLAAVVIPIIVGFVGFLFVVALHMAGYLTFDGSTAYMSMIVRYGLWSIPLLGGLLTGVALITHGRKTSTDRR